MRLGMRLVILLVLALALAERPARACGAFASAAWVKAPPRLGLERTLIVWDSATKMQHFVRELRFAHAAGSFGFVVPTPSRPSVHSIEKSPFDELEKRYPAALFSDVGLLGFGSGLGYGAGLGAGAGARAKQPPPVQVVEQKRVGDFTAFVLTATDKGALAAWLEKHGFKSSDAGKTWMDIYVRLGFHFVALRYDGTKSADEQLTSRTLRISFESELPYYPYREPADAPSQANRELSLWVVSDALLVPYAGVTHQDEWRLRRPFSEGDRFVPEVGGLEETLGKELSGLLPRSRYVQTFGDFKPKRHGWEDAVFVPLGACDEACRSARARLVPWLDARMTDVAPTPPASSATSAPSPTPSASAHSAPSPSASANALSCAFGRPASGAWWLVALGALVVRRRRWRALLPLAALALFSCDRPAPPQPAPSASVAPAPPPSASAAFAQPPAAFVAPREVEARKRAVLDVLSNRFDGYVPVWSLPDEGGMGATEHGDESALADTLTHAKDCVAGLDAVVTLEADLDAKGVVKQARALGPLPRKARECIERHIAETAFTPEGGERTERTHAYFGARSEEAKRVERAMQKARRRFVPSARARLRQGATTASEGLPKELVQRIVRQRWAQLVSCHGMNAKGSTDVSVKWSIDAEGTPTHVRATAPKNAALASCVAGVFRQMRFPKPEKAPMQASMRLDFHAD